MPIDIKMVPGAATGGRIVKWLGLGFIILIAFLIANPFTVIPAGHVGVKDFFGTVSAPSRPGIDLWCRSPGLSRCRSRPGAEGDGRSALQGGPDHVPRGVAAVPPRPGQGAQIYKTVGQRLRVRDGRAADALGDPRDHRVLRGQGPLLGGAGEIATEIFTLSRS